MRIFSGTEIGNQVGINMKMFLLFHLLWRAMSVAACFVAVVCFVYRVTKHTFCQP